MQLPERHDARAPEGDVAVRLGVADALSPDVTPWHVGCKISHASGERAFFYLAHACGRIERSGCLADDGRVVGEGQFIITICWAILMHCQLDLLDVAWGSAFEKLH